ncbi:DEKNAAC100046 [Brettanomyces naardenensis]|uniref:Large ribosomal subunit protein uL30m n=1 Tax=Brettanomyces naardenensis TaxID=13370 RepID=A0A448YGN6_BRENA|nr:DEKNAAC100046 [Brettanomyces naardenensis]
MSSIIPKFFKVTQLKSTIAVPIKKKQTLQRLGLHKRHQVVYQKITPQQAGMIASVKELVKVELSVEEKSKDQLREERKSDPGFVVVSKRR